MRVAQVYKQLSVLILSFLGFTFAAEAAQPQVLLQTSAGATCR